MTLDAMTCHPHNTLNLSINIVFSNAINFYLKRSLRFILFPGFFVVYQHFAYIQYSYRESCIWAQRILTVGLHSSSTRSICPKGQSVLHITGAHSMAKAKWIPPVFIFVLFLIWELFVDKMLCYSIHILIDMYICVVIYLWCPLELVSCIVLTTLTKSWKVT